MLWSSEYTDICYLLILQGGEERKGILWKVNLGYREVIWLLQRCGGSHKPEYRGYSQNLACSQPIAEEGC